MVRSSRIKHRRSAPGAPPLLFRSKDSLLQVRRQGDVEHPDVKAGDVIGYVGTSAKLECAEGPHLHFELKLNGVLLNPLYYIETT